MERKRWWGNASPSSLLGHRLGSPSQALRLPPFTWQTLSFCPGPGFALGPGITNTNETQSHRQGPERAAAPCWGGASPELPSPAWAWAARASRLPLQPLQPHGRWLAARSYLNIRSRPHSPHFQGSAAEHDGGDRGGADTELSVVLGRPLGSTALNRKHLCFFFCRLVRLSAVK